MPADAAWRGTDGWATHHELLAQIAEQVDRWGRSVALLTAGQKSEIWQPTRIPRPGDQSADTTPTPAARAPAGAPPAPARRHPNAMTVAEFAATHRPKNRPNR